MERGSDALYQAWSEEGNDAGSLEKGRERSTQEAEEGTEEGAREGGSEDGAREAAREEMREGWAREGAPNEQGRVRDREGEMTRGRGRLQSVHVKS